MRVNTQQPTQPLPSVTDDPAATAATSAPETAPETTAATPAATPAAATPTEPATTTPAAPTAQLTPEGPVPPPEEPVAVDPKDKAAADKAAKKIEFKRKMRFGSCVSVVAGAKILAPIMSVLKTNMRLVPGYSQGGLNGVNKLMVITLGGEFTAQALDAGLSPVCAEKHPKARARLGMTIFPAALGGAEIVGALASREPSIREPLLLNGLHQGMISVASGTTYILLNKHPGNLKKERQIRGAVHLGMGALAMIVGGGVQYAQEKHRAEAYQSTNPDNPNPGPFVDDPSMVPDSNLENGGSYDSSANPYERKLPGFGKDLIQIGASHVIVGGAVLLQSHFTKESKENSKEKPKVSINPQVGFGYAGLSIGGRF